MFIPLLQRQVFKYSTAAVQMVHIIVRGMSASCNNGGPQEFLPVSAYP